MTATDASTKTSEGLLPSKLESSLLWRIKLRLQFTGWLQFILHAIAVLPCLLLAGIAWLLSGGASVAFWLLFAPGAVLLAMLVFDVVTVKGGLRPFEPAPVRLDGLDAFDLMRARRSCRVYQARDLTPEHRAELLEAVRRYTRPEELLGDRLVRLEYVAAPLTVWPVLGAREFLVAIAPGDYDRLAVIDLGRSLQKVVLHATRMGLGTCWIGPGADQRSVAEHLGDRFDPDRDHVICVCAVGYRSRYRPSYLRWMQLFLGRRLPLRSLFFADPRFSAPLDVEAPPFAAYGRCYEVCQWAPSSYNTQTTRCAAVTEDTGGRLRPLRFDFCAATNSRYYAAVAVGIWLASWEIGCRALGRRGHLAVLSPGERGVSGAPALPRYDASWVVAYGDGERGTG